MSDIQVKGGWIRLHETKGRLAPGTRGAETGVLWLRTDDIFSVSEWQGGAFITSSHTNEAWSVAESPDDIIEALTAPTQGEDEPGPLRGHMAILSKIGATIADLKGTSDE